MNLRFLLPLAIPVLLSSCDKTVEPAPDPAPESTLTRTLVYPNQNNLMKQGHYPDDYGMETLARVEEGQLILGFAARPKGNNTSGESIIMHIEEKHLASGLTRTYRFGDPAHAISYARYVYTWQRENGGIWGSITDSNMGIGFGGELTITRYDPVKRLVSGTYTITVNDLLNDPMKESSFPIDPVNKCHLTVNGLFRNVKIQ